MKTDIIERFDNGLNKLIDAGMVVSSIAIFLMMIFVVVAAVGRYLTGTMIIPGLYEMTGYYLMPLAIFPAFVYSYMNGVFPFMDNIVVKTPKQFQRWVQTFILLLEVFLFAVLVYFTLKNALIGTEKMAQMRAGANLMPLYPFYYLAPYGFGLMTIKAAVLFVKQLRSKEMVMETTLVE